MIYISGAIVGATNYMERFDAAEKELKDRGFKVISPARHNELLLKETEYKDYMNASLELLKVCSSIYMLDGWENSKGARLEHAYAEAMGIEIMYQASTPPEEKRYYWHLKGKFDCYTYLNFEDGIFLTSKTENYSARTEFTESEFKDLAQRFDFPEDMFVKEEINE